MTYLIGGPIDQAADWGVWRVKHHTLSGQPTCADPGWYREIQVASAYSPNPWHPPGEPRGREHVAQTTVDDDSTTAWAQWFYEDDERSWIEWRFPERSDVLLMCVRNGFPNTQESYLNNRRLREVELKGCGDVNATLHDYVNPTTQELDGRNFQDYQNVRMDCETRRVRLIGQSYYPAQDRSHLLTISDVKFYTGFSFSPRE